jgi:hypothetical protein
MAGRFEFESPGAAFTGEITKLLATRKAEERQRLLDSLSFSADQRAQEALEREKRESDARMESQKQEDILRRLGTTASFMEPGDDPASRGLSPEDIAAGQRIGMWKEQPVPQVSTAITGMTDEAGTPTENFTPEQATAPAPKKQLAYVGNPAQRERLRKRTEQGNMIAEMLGSNNPAERQKGELLVKLINLNDGEIPKEAQGLLMPNKPVSVFSQSTGKLTDAGSVAPNAEVITQGYPPRELRGPQALYAGTSEEDGSTVFVDPTDWSEHKIRGTRRGPDTSQNGLGVPQGMLNDHRANNYMLRPDDYGKVDPARMGRFRQSALQIIASTKASPKVKELANLFVTNTPRYEQVLPTVQGLSTQDVNQLRQLLGAIADPQTVEIMRRNPPAQFKDQK